MAKNNVMTATTAVAVFMLVSVAVALTINNGQPRRPKPDSVAVNTTVDGEQNAIANSQGGFVPMTALLQGANAAPGSGWLYSHDTDESSRFFTEFRAKFPDYRFSIDEELRLGDFVASLWTLAGTETNNDTGINSDDGDFTVRGVTISAYVPGKGMIYRTVCNPERPPAHD